MNWFTFGAQIVNFLILVALLKHFLYGPIMRAMEKREETIRSRLRTAREKRDEAEARIREYEEKVRDIDGRREQLLKEAREEADRRRQELERVAREEVQGHKQRWMESLEQEKAAFLGDIEQRLNTELLAAMRRALADLADAPLEDRLAEAFVARLSALDDDARRALRQALDENNRPVIRSVFEVPGERRGAITDAVHKALETEAAVAFETDRDVLGGIELRVGGRKFAWSLRRYADELKEQMQQALAQQAPAGGKEPADAESEQSGE
jgi:F-type H+-transporting ATPase subunit b